MKPMDIREIRGFDIVSVSNHPYMFTNLRVDRDSLPDGFVAYDVRDSDCNGEFAQIKDFVIINHWGTIIGIDKIPMDSKYHDYIPDDTICDGNFIGEYVKTPEEFMARYNELLKEVA